jgi:hypothetical protein
LNVVAIVSEPNGNTLAAMYSALALSVTGVP